jgi:hypothetical protein
MLASDIVFFSCSLIIVSWLAVIVSVKDKTYLTEVKVPAMIAATTGTITMFFLNHSSLLFGFFILLMPNTYTIFPENYTFSMFFFYAYSLTIF